MKKIEKVERSVKVIANELLSNEQKSKKVIEKSKKVKTDEQLLLEKLSKVNADEYAKKTERNHRKWKLSFLESLRAIEANKTKSSNSIRNIAKAELLRLSVAVNMQFAILKSFQKTFETKEFRTYLAYIKNSFENADVRPNYTGDNKKAKAEKISDAYIILKHYHLKK